MLAVALALSTLAACSLSEEGAGGCRLTERERQYGLSGEWAWTTPEGRSTLLCLRQRSPVQVEGTIRERGGPGRRLAGAVAPSGAIFLVQPEGRRSPVLWVARRTGDTIFVDWTGTVDRADEPPSAASSAAGRMLRAR